MAVPILRLNIDDNPRIIVKQDTTPVTITGNTYYNFIASGETVITQVQTGNLVDVTIYNPSGSSATWGMIVGDINNQTDLTDYVYTLIVPAITGNTQDISDLNDSLTAHTSQVGSGSIHFTGHTFTQSGITVITQVGDNVNIYVPADAITGVTWGSITGTLSGQTDLWNVLAEKVDSQVYHDDLQTLSDTIDSNATGVTATFVTLTGTTLPATYLTLSDFNTFSGTTLPANYYTQTAADALLVDKVDWVLYQDDLQGIYEAISGITSGLTTTLSGCTDVTITSPADNDILKYSGGTWINETSVDLFTSVNDGDLLQRSGTTVVGIAISGLTITLQSAINTYTGTTAPASFLPITGLTGYWTSAQTENYVTGLGYLTGYTVTADDVTGITATLYSPTGHTHSTYVEKIATIVTLTASTILDSSYASKIVEVNSTGNTTITLYSGATIGTRIDIVNVNTGDVTLAAQGTLQSDGTKLATQYTGASVYARGTSTWLAVGKLTT